MMNAIDTQLFDFKKLPKVSLHDHLDGGVRVSTLFELANNIGYKLPEDNVDNLKTWFKNNAQSRSLLEYLNTFKHTEAIMQDRLSLTRIASEMIEDLAKDGVVYAEIRYAPEKHINSSMNLYQVVEAVNEGINDGINKMKRIGLNINAHQILSAMRNQKYVQKIAELAVAYRYNGVVGFDIAGPEKGYPASLYENTFNYLAQEFFPITIHAGEDCGIESIIESLIKGRALRLGHGVRIIDDIQISYKENNNVINYGKTAEWIKDRQIPLELCPTSNIHTKALGNIQLCDHPIDELYKLGFNTTINTDNRLISNITLSDEFKKLVNVFNYDLHDLKKMTMNAADSAFISYEDKQKLKQKIELSYRNVNIS